jgi:hypothetical protein
MCIRDRHITDNYYTTYKFNEDLMFVYTFLINDSINITYTYIKDVNKCIIFESLIIDKNEVILSIYDNYILCTLSGTESLNKKINNTNLDSLYTLSAVKYVNKNSNLEDTLENKYFKLFISFVNGLTYYKIDYYNNDKLNNIYKKIINDNKIDQLKEWLDDWGKNNYLISKGYYGTSPTLLFKLKDSPIQLTNEPCVDTKCLILYYDLWYNSLINSDKLVIIEDNTLNKYVMQHVFNVAVNKQEVVYKNTKYTLTVTDEGSSNELS